MLDQMQISTLKFIYFLKSHLEERSERGATAVEYGLMVALIAAVIVGTVTLLGTALNTKFDAVYQKIK